MRAAARHGFTIAKGSVMAKSAPHPFDKEAAEGSRDIIDRELQRQERAQSDRESKKAAGEKSSSGQEEKRDH
jgi:hypothetical protein